MARSVIVIAALSAALLIQAERWGVEFSASGSISAGDAAGGKHGNGFDVGGMVRYRTVPDRMEHAGTGSTGPHAVKGIRGPRSHLEGGFEAGLGVAHPLRARWRAAVRGGGAGATSRHFAPEGPEGETALDSGHDSPSGLSLQLHARWSVTTGLGVRAPGNEVEIDPVTAPVEPRSMAFKLGFGMRF